MIVREEVFQPDVTISPVFHVLNSVILQSFGVITLPNISLNTEDNRYWVPAFLAANIYSEWRHFVFKRGIIVSY